jgi:hypothetical protein
MRIGIAVALLAGMTVFAPGLVSAEEPAPSIESLVVEMAHTPAEHEALAKYYRAKAADARAEASRHEAMGSSYGTGKMTQRAQMEKHCAKIAELDNAMADQYDALAKAHEEAAKQAP